MSNRQEVVSLAYSWVGLKKSDKSYMKIIDIYNSQKKFPRGLKMQPSWSWCACTWSALAIALGYTDIMPVEISCGELVELAKKMGIWKENDGYIPMPGDAILFDWDDNGKGDDIGWPDHIGTVVEVNQSAGYFTTVEGNYQGAVKCRTVNINGRYIRGFIAPKYSDNEYIPFERDSNLNVTQLAYEVIAGHWGSGDERVKRLNEAGFDAKKIQSQVNKILKANASEKVESGSLDQPYNKRVISNCKATDHTGSIAGMYKTTANLYCRTDAGTNKKALCLIPKGTEVFVNGDHTRNWYVVTSILDQVYYKGFCHREYLTRS